MSYLPSWGLLSGFSSLIHCYQCPQGKQFRLQQFLGLLIIIVRVSLPSISIRESTWHPPDPVCLPTNIYIYGSWATQHTCPMLSVQGNVGHCQIQGQNGKNPPNRIAGVITAFDSACLFNSLCLWSHRNLHNTGNFSSLCTVPLVKDRNKKLTLQPHLSVLCPHPPSVNGGSLRSSGQTAPVYEIKLLPILMSQSRVAIALQQFGVCCRSAVAAASTGKRAELL